jgi:hypothetical protein
MLEVAIMLLKNHWGQLVMAFIGGFLYGFYSVEQPDIQAITRNAEAGRDAVWEAKYAELERQGQAAVAEAVAARDTLEPADADVGKLCDTDAQCRDKAR